MFEAILKFFKKLTKSNAEESNNSKDTAKERLHLVLMQDRANVSADFLELMKQEIIDVIKKYIEVDESAIDVRLTNKTTEDGENGAPALYANIPILNIRNDMKKIETKPNKENIENSQEQSNNEQDVEKSTEELVETTKTEEKQEEISEETNIVSDESTVTEEKQEDIKVEKKEPEDNNTENKQE